MASNNPNPSSDTPIAIKLALNNGENRRFKLALRDLGANTLPDKLRSVLAVPADQDLTLERFSDSAGSYITLDSNNPAVYKQLYRAAKAKLKLRIKATISDPPAPKVDSIPTPSQLPAHCYTPPKNVSSPSLEAKATEEQLLSGLVAPTMSSTAGAKSSPGEPEELMRRPNLRFKLPYDPCLSPSITATATQSLLDTANPVIGEANVKQFSTQPKQASSISHGGNHTLQDYHMQLRLLEQQNKKRLLMARQEQDHLTDAPVPHSFTAREDLVARCPSIAAKGQKDSASDPKQPLATFVGASFIISCNKCQANIPNTHWHCGTCNAGDFDLCASCIEKGILCESEDHWLIKRTIKDGNVLTSETETIPSKTAVKMEGKQDIPEASVLRATEEKSNAKCEDLNLYRTCNSCVQSFPDSKFVTCKICEDFDLCVPCFVGQKHGHHPSHAFAPACASTKMDSVAIMLCSPGRNTRHFAICDGCDKDIYGTRHKCLNCPDWDFCSTCVKTARISHPGHRFIPLHEPIPFANQRSPVHYNINCDGPLCRDVSGYIVGDRYKCAVCHDTDFCAKCEALPTNRHNRTHPLIKFKSPVRNVSVTTLGEKENGEHMCTMGDQLPQTSSKATETIPVAASANAATQVQTIAEVKPTETIKAEPKPDDSKASLSQEFQAHFVRDAVADGSLFQPSQTFEQVWTLRNPGPHVWPAGCSVRFTGGDTMFNIDPNHPSSVSDLVKATESNVALHEVRVGEEVNFTVVMRTPEREGKAISYWRLKTGDGVPFGHKLWCDIIVQTSNMTAVKDKVKEEDKIAIKKEPAVEIKKEEDAASSTHSQMIFPKLDKESTVLEIHEAAAAAPSASSAGSVASAVTANEEKALLEDVENLDLEDDNVSTEDGFMTDEEFEMLDASEDDFAEAVNGKQK
ncbi:MAG: hypothetical protein Q9181_000094 [Wetmoreana brouardii]